MLAGQMLTGADANRADANRADANRASIRAIGSLQDDMKDLVCPFTPSLRLYSPSTRTTFYDTSYPGSQACHHVIAE